MKGGGSSQILIRPRGYRPPSGEAFAVSCGGCTAANVGVLHVVRTGAVTVNTGSGYNLDGVTFRPAG